MQLPHPPREDNERALAGLQRERFTGLTGTTITLVDNAVEGIEAVYKNGALLDASGGAGGYSILGKTITLGAAAIAGDVFFIFYYARVGT